MNLDDIQLPLLLNSPGSLGVGTDERREPGGPRDSVSDWPRQQARDGPPAPDAQRPRPGLGRAPAPRDPRWSPDKRNSSRAGVQRAQSWVVWGPRLLPSSFACKRPHLVSANNYPVGAARSCHSLRLD